LPCTIPTRRIFPTLWKRPAESAAAALAVAAEPFRSALSILVFYINSALKSLPASRRRTLDRAKTELRRQFGRD
jgi:hypothetical protein